MPIKSIVAHHADGLRHLLRLRLAALKKEANCPDETIHRQVRYLNNIVEADHGKLKA